MITENDLGAVKPDYQVIAAGFKVEGAIERFAQEITPEYVGLILGFRGVHELYKAQLHYHEKTGLAIVDPINFESWLSEHRPNTFDLIDGPAGYEDLMERLDQVPIPETTALIKLIEHRGAQRKRIDRTQQLLAAVQDVENPDMEKIVRLNAEVLDLYKEIDYNPMDRVRTPLDIIADIDSLVDIPPFLPTPYPDLNKALAYDADKGGFFRGAVHTVAALSGRGKSTFVKCLCNHWLDNGFKVLFINFEEAQSHWERILLTQTTGVNVYETDLDAISCKAFEKRMTRWKDLLKIRHDPDTLFYEDLEIWMRDVIGYSSWKPDIIVIDTIQSMFIKSGGSARWGEFEQIMVRLEKLAKDLDAAVIITAQQNINSTKEKREVINQSDMGGSVTITQKSTVTLFLTQARDTGEWAESRNVVEIQIPKNRITGNTFTDVPPRLLYNDKNKSFEVYEYDKPEILPPSDVLTLANSDDELGYFND